MLEKGQSGVKLTTNKTDEENLKVYKIYEETDDDGNTTLKIVDITEDDPDIKDIADGTFKRYELTAPNEDCYIMSLFNGLPQFFRVGTPTMRVYMYANKTGLDIDYKLSDFSGEEVSSGTLDELDFGVYYMTPDDVGDYIFEANGVAPIPIHTPYVVDTVGMSGKITFQKAQWMLLAVPKKDWRISDLVEAVEDKYDVKGEDIFRVFSAYPATNTQSKEMLDYKPNYTPNDTKYNFQLVYEDTEGGESSMEITGFWVYVNDYELDDSDELIVFEW
jgi:hypothetical protein